MKTDFLIVGAGPFGLSMAAYARRTGIDHVMLGVPMGFWTDNMPPGMLLRSTPDWHLDPFNEHTIERFLELRDAWPWDGQPLSLDLYLGYARWFQREAGIVSTPGMVARLDVSDSGTFEARLDDGAVVEARAVLLAPGFSSFAYEPPELLDVLPPGRFRHTCAEVDPSVHAGRRVVIVGGRQSAFEWAALIREAGAREVHVVHRHPTPSFEDTDWSWVDAMVEAMADDPEWFRRLSAEERAEIDRRFWESGRLKLEPWLADRVYADGISLWPERTIEACDVLPDGTLRCRLSDGTPIDADHVVLATGYRTDMCRLPYLASGNLLERLDLDDGEPVLDSSFQTSVPRLYITSMPATRDFGAFFAFTVSVRASARVIGRAVTSDLTG